MSDQPQHPGGPGLPRQAQIRTGARIGGIALTVLGVVLVVVGIGMFATFFSNSYDPFAEEGIPRPLLGLPVVAAGGFALVFGRGLLGVGYGGATARYAAGELAPVVRDTVDHVRGGGQVGAADGPFCRACGVRNRSTASFCDGCGQSLA